MEQPEPSNGPNLPPAADKQALRLWAKAVRSRVRAEEGWAPDEYVRTALSASGLFQSANTVGLYLPMAEEVDIEPLVSAGRRFVAPRVQMKPSPHLTFHELGAGTEQHRWGLREPAANAPQVPIQQIDLLLVPGLLFDEQGGRLGYGKGFYDRALAQAPASTVTVGVTLDTLVVPLLPLAKHDVAVQHLVTETGLRPVRR